MKLKKKITFLSLILLFFSAIVVGITTNQKVAADDDESAAQMINEFFNNRGILKNGAKAEILDESQVGDWYEHQFLIYDKDYHDFDHMPYGNYTIGNEIYATDWKKPSDQNLKVTFYSTLYNPKTMAEIQANTQGSVNIPAGKDSGYAFWVIKVRCDKDGIKVLSQKDYDKAPSSPYSVKQVKNIFFKKLTLESNRKAIKKSSFIGNKPKFSFSNVSLIKDEVTWMYRKNFQRSMISYKGKLPVHDYDFKAHVRVNNFKPSKKNRTYDLGDRDGDTIAKIHVPKNSRNGSGTIKLDLNLTFNDYFFTAKL